MEFVPFPYFSREPQPAGRYYRGKVRYFYRGVEVGDAVGPSTRNFARAAGWDRERLARDGDVVRGKRWSWQSRWQFLATMALADLTFRRSKGVFWRPGCFQIFVKNLDGKRGSCITEAVTARCKRGH